MGMGKYILRSFLAIVIILGLSLGNIHGIAGLAVRQARADTPVRTDAVVLVNSDSYDYNDFSHLIQPYLDTFGISYTILNIKFDPVSSSIGNYAVIIIGHRSLDDITNYLDATEETNIANAVAAGTGLVNFDNNLSYLYSGIYQFIQSIFNFSYTGYTVGSGITFGTPHYITSLHQPDEEINTLTNMEMAGITLPANDTALAWTLTQPFLTVTTYGQGRAVQWGTYDWIPTSVRGPVYRLDDLVWRSIVWAARKPFVMQGLPPFLTMRVDDVLGPLDWVDVAVGLGIKPWVGLFYNNIDAGEASHISTLANANKITAGIHAKTTDNFFYFDHTAGTNLSDAVINANYTEGTAFFTSNNIPISKYLVPHFYEIGTNAFQGLSNWNVQFLGIQMSPGGGYYSSNWLTGGPYRLYESGSASTTLPEYYADYVSVPGRPGFDNQFFNCVTEIRDNAGYEWYPGVDVAGTIERGTLQTQRALSSMVLATLFTHEDYIVNIPLDTWQTELQSIQANLEPYGPIYVTMDYACQYVRAMYKSYISAGTYDLSLNKLSTTLSGSADMPTKFYVFTQSGSNIRQIMVDVPAFSGSTVVDFTLPGALDHITVTPASATVLQDSTQSFTAMGYDASNNPIPNLAIRWSVVNGGGTIDMDGVFTASGDVGNYPNTIRAAYNGMYGYASVAISGNIDIAVTTGWNMVSVPVQTADMRLSVLFPGVTAPAYYYTTSYQPVQASDTLVTGRGYWMYFSTPHNYSIVGQPVSLQNINVSQGWNLIGVFNQTLQASSITSTPSGILTLPLYSYSNGYTQAPTLQPGGGYWAYATQAGTLHLAGGGGLAEAPLQPQPEDWNTPQDFRLSLDAGSPGAMTTLILGVSPQGSSGYDPGLDLLSPPPGPTGALDVRMTNDGLDFRTDVRDSLLKTYTFTLYITPAQAGEDTLLRWNADALPSLGKFEIVDLAGGEQFRLDMSTTSELLIQSGSPLYGALQIRVTTGLPSYITFLPVMVH